MGGTISVAMLSRILAPLVFGERAGWMSVRASVPTVGNLARNCVSEDQSETEYVSGAASDFTGPGEVLPELIIEAEANGELEAEPEEPSVEPKAEPPEPEPDEYSFKPKTELVRPSAQRTAAAARPTA